MKLFRSEYEPSPSMVVLLLCMAAIVAAAAAVVVLLLFPKVMVGLACLAAIAVMRKERGWW